MSLFYSCMKPLIITEEVLQTAGCYEECVLYFNELKKKEYELFDLIDKCMKFRNFRFAVFLVENFFYRLTNEQIKDLFDIYSDCYILFHAGDSFIEERINEIIDMYIENDWEFCDSVVHCIKWHLTVEHKMKIIDFHIKNNYSFWNILEILTNGLPREYVEKISNLLDN